MRHAEAFLPMGDVTGLTDDLFLGGALRLRQPRAGFRAGLDGVLLGASVPEGFAGRLIDVGTGTGIVALTAAHWAREARVTALEAVPEMATIARANADANGLGDRVTVVEGDLLDALGGLPAAGFEHVLTNPPYFDPARERASPDAMKAKALMMAGAGAETAVDLEAWLTACVKLLVPKGTLTLVHRAEALGTILAALEGRCGAVRVLPLWPRSGEPARRILLRAVKGARTPLTLLSGLALHGADTRFTSAADAVLRGKARLSL